MNISPPSGELALMTADLAVQEHERFLADLGEQISPRSSHPPSERMIAACRRGLLNLVGHIAAALDAPPHAAEWLARDADFLRHMALCPALTDYLARQEALMQLARQLGLERPDDGSYSLLRQLSDDADPLIAQSAAGLLDLEPARLDRIVWQIDQMPSDLLVWLTQQVASALEQRDAAPAGEGRAAFLARHNENAGLLHSAYKLAYLLESNDRTEALDDALNPLQGGIALFCASLALRLDCDPHLVAHVLCDQGVTRLAVMLRAAVVSDEQAASVFAALALGRHEMAALVTAFDSFHAIGPDHAWELVRNWSLPQIGPP